MDAKQETKAVVRTTMGLVIKFNSTEDILGYYNRNSRIYEIRNGNELWHKGHNCLAGVIEGIHQ